MKTFRQKSGGASRGFGVGGLSFQSSRFGRLGPPDSSTCCGKIAGQQGRTKEALSLLVRASLAISRRPPSLWRCRTTLVTPQETGPRLPGCCQGPQKGQSSVRMEGHKQRRWQKGGSAIGVVAARSCDLSRVPDPRISSDDFQNNCFHT